MGSVVQSASQTNPLSGVKPTLERLEAVGYSRLKAVERIERVLARTYPERNGFDQERFVKLLKELT